MKSKSVVQVCVAGLFLLASILSNAQEKIRTVEKGLSYPKQPIEIIALGLDDKPFNDNSRVMGEQDWLSKLTLSVKNVSNKNIMSFNIDLLIKKEGRILFGIPVHFYSFTKPADSDVLTAEGDKKIGVLRPGEIVKVKVSDRTMQMYGKHLVKNEVENIDRVTIDLRWVYFDDRSRWMYGQESRPDPDNPGKRIRIDKPEP